MCTTSPVSEQPEMSAVTPLTKTLTVAPRRHLLTFALMALGACTRLLGGPQPRVYLIASQPIADATCRRGFRQTPKQPVDPPDHAVAVFRHAW